MVRHQIKSSDARQSPLALFWFRRDLRLNDNAGLWHALNRFPHVQPIFIFDTNILNRLEDRLDARLCFIHKALTELKAQLNNRGSDLWVFYGDPLEIVRQILSNHPVNAIFCNHDYEPYATQRDRAVADFCASSGVELRTFKDQVIFEKAEVLNEQGKPYTVFTPYKKKWLKQLREDSFKPYDGAGLFGHFNPRAKAEILPMPNLEDLGFSHLSSAQERILFPPKKVPRRVFEKYARNRDFPALKHGTTRLGVHLRFGTIGIRDLIAKTHALSPVFLTELIWREFFMQILFHFPRVVKESFKPDYDKIRWRDSKEDFARWCAGQTGYAFVDAGMRQLNRTGYMHNRLRMVTASFLTKHLLIDWREGERYFARKLLDYELASNNGNWQWVAGTGCDAAPYFRVFNPESQMAKFDPQLKYVKAWVPEHGSADSVGAIVDAKFARVRALREYKKALSKSGGVKSAAKGTGRRD